MNTNESQFKQVDASDTEARLRRARVPLTPASLRKDTFNTGFKGPAKNGVRTREPGGGSAMGAHFSPEQYNKMSTALTNMAASGEGAKLGAAHVEQDKAAPEKTIKIRS